MMMNIIQDIAEVIEQMYLTDHDAETISYHVIDKFILAVEQRAEEKMLKTHKLEGAHYAAMKELRSGI